MSNGLYGFGKDQRTHAEKTRDALTSSMKSKIKDLIGKCEACNQKRESRLLEVHHISEVAKADGSVDKNIPRNLIVMCLDCHKDAHDKEITKKDLKARITKRSQKTKSQLKDILANRSQIVDSDIIPFRIEIPSLDESGSMRKKVHKATTPNNKKRGKKSHEDPFERMNKALSRFE